MVTQGHLPISLESLLRKGCALHHPGSFLQQPQRLAFVEVLSCILSRAFWQLQLAWACGPSSLAEAHGSSDGVGGPAGAQDPPTMSVSREPQNVGTEGTQARKEVKTYFQM